MSTEDNKQLVLRWKAERNQGNVDVVEDLCAKDCVRHMSGLLTPGPVRGRPAFKRLVAAHLAAFAFQSMPEFLVAEDDLEVVLRDLSTHTSRGRFRGFHQQGRK